MATATDSQVTQPRQVRRPDGSAGTEAQTVVTDLDLVLWAVRGLHGAATNSDDGATVAAVEHLGAASVDATGAAAAFGMASCGIGLQPSVETITAGSGAVVKVGFVAEADAPCRAAAKDYAVIRGPRDDLERCSASSTPPSLCR